MLNRTVVGVQPNGQLHSRREPGSDCQLKIRQLLPALIDLERSQSPFVMHSNDDSTVPVKPCGNFMAIPERYLRATINAMSVAIGSMCSVEFAIGRAEWLGN